MNIFSPEARVEGSMMGFISPYVGSQHSKERIMANVIETTNDVSTYNKKCRIIRIFTDAGEFETAEVVEPKDPMWRNIPA